jgi:hypothetical protein
MYELERKRPINRYSTAEIQNVRDRVGKAIGMSGRNLDRYLRVLETPMPVQDAVDAGRLPLVIGAKVATLPKAQQEELAEQIKDLTGVGAVLQAVTDILGLPQKRRHVKANDALCSFARSLDRGLDDLDGRVTQVGAPVVRENLPTIEKAHKVLSQLMSIAKRLKTG